MVLDSIIFFFYMALVLSVGFYYYRRNHSHEDYYVAGRDISSWHNGLSVVATDVGGGFSIGLGGLGFTMGLSGSWLLFTGLIGAWLAAAVLIPRLYALPQFKKLTTLPQIFDIYYGKSAAFIAGIITTISYLGFTSAQIVAGAKLASGTFPEISFHAAILLMGGIAIGYTILGGLKAVIYTDTFQWIVLLSGLLFVALPFAYIKVGGWASIRENISPDMLSLGHIEISTIFNWAITIIPIWFVGMTLYQRIYASRSEKEAKKAWLIAGVFEWPIMAFLGVSLGLLARVAYTQNLFEVMSYPAGAPIDPEIGLPVLLRVILPHGFMGLVLASYFSAVMSTADSCLMACSGSFVTDLLRPGNRSPKKQIRLSQWVTLIAGVCALILALFLNNVLEAMLFSYGFMVSGLLIPVLGALFYPSPSPLSGLSAMIAGGSVTTLLSVLQIHWIGIDPNFYGISAAIICFFLVNTFKTKSS